MPTFNYITLAQARQQLANRLYDQTQTFWSAPELTTYILEALRTFNAYSSYWRGEFVFPLQPGVQWYDLPTLSTSLRPYTVTDQVLYPGIQYSLLEPSPTTVLNPWTGASLQFSADDLVSSLSRSRDLVQSLVGCTYTRHLIPATAGRTPLPDVTIDLRRVAYQPASASGYGIGAYGAGPYGISPSLSFRMFPEDTWALEAFKRRYLTTPAGIPKYYVQTTQPPLAFDTDRPPNAAGQYEVLTIDAGPALTVTSAPTTLNIPDDWTHLLKWATLADLLARDSNAADDIRAQYCTARVKMGVKMLETAPSVIAIRNQNSGATLRVDSIRSLDLYNRNWQSALPGFPAMIGLAGLNLLAVTPPPDSGPYSLMATVVRNAPLPTKDSDPIQCNRGDLDAILGYAQHIASFKQGGAEFLATMPLYDRFLHQCSNYSKKYDEIGEYATFLLGLAGLEEATNPRSTEESDS